MSKLLTIKDIQLVAGRIRRMLKNDLIKNEVLTRDVTTLLDALEHVDKIIFKEIGE